jgi:hypothetical protein
MTRRKKAEYSFELAILAAWVIFFGIALLA